MNNLIAVLILVLGIVGIIVGAMNREYRGSSYWFYIAFWLFVLVAAGPHLSISL